MKFIAATIFIFLALIVLKEIFYKESMKIESPAFKNNAYMPSNFSCDGEKVNPQLNFLDIPKNAESLVLIADDPDAPMGTFVHWIMYNIPPNTTGVKENENIKNALSGINSTGKTGYIPTCPPTGTHRYFFKLYALNSSLQINAPADKEKIEQAMQNHILAQAELIGLYKRR